MYRAPAHGTPAHAAPPPRRRMPLLPLVGICVGLALLLLPVALDLRESWEAGRVVSTMASQAGSSAEESRWLAQADAYNRRLAGEDGGGGGAAAGEGAGYPPTAATGDTDDASGGGPLAGDAVLPYEEQLGGADGAPVAWVEIPRIGVRLPVYLGTSDAVLSSGVGHVEGTSLPVGGPSTHCVLTGHSGLYDSRMFDDIRELAPGDLFAVHVMGRTCTYEVTGTETVEPDDVSGLGIRAGQDLCTLVTCTPYGVNDHRLLVHARRTDRTLPRQDAGRALASRLSAPRLWPLVLGLVLAAAGLLAWVVGGGHDRAGDARRAARPPRRPPAPRP